MNNKQRRVVTLLLICLMATVGCKTVHNARRTDPVKLQQEGTVVFVRPSKYTPLRLGTKSISAYVEVAYEDFKRNAAGLLEVHVGLRNKGGTVPWDLRGRDFPLSVKTAFYDQPLAGQATRAAPVYETNWQTVILIRGETTDFKVVCPVKSGAYYQVLVSELK